MSFGRRAPTSAATTLAYLHRRRAILKRLSSFSYRSLLDVGCGDGELIVWLRQRIDPTVDVWGVDFSSETIARNAVRHPHARFDVLNIEHQQLDKTFDAIVCTEVIEHLDNREAAMKHLAAMLSPGGHLVLTCPAGKVHATERHFGHISHPDPSELRAMAQGCGLEAISLENWGFPQTASNISPT